MAGKSVKSIILRGLAVVSFLTAAIVMFLSYQKLHRDSVTFVVKYNDWNGFSFCLIVYCIGCLYHFLVLFIPSGSQLWKTVIVLDVIVNVVVGASLGAGWQTYILTKQGNRVGAGWRPLCSIASYFCAKILGSLITSTLGFAVSIALLMSTLHICVDPLLLGNSS